jgi:hypothetical protein
MLSKDDPRDRELIPECFRIFRIGTFPEREAKMTREERDKEIDSYIESYNDAMVKWGWFFKQIYEIYKKYAVELWFLVASG